MSNILAKTANRSGILAFVCILAGGLAFLHHIETSEITITGNRWLSLVQDNWRESGGVIQARDNTDPSKRGKGLIVSKDVWKDVSLELSIVNPRHAAIWIRFEDEWPRNYLKLVIRDNKVHWEGSLIGKPFCLPEKSVQAISPILPVTISIKRNSVSAKAGLTALEKLEANYPMGYICLQDLGGPGKPQGFDIFQVRGLPHFPLKTWLRYLPKSVSVPFFFLYGFLLAASALLFLKQTGIIKQKQTVATAVCMAAVAALHAAMWAFYAFPFRRYPLTDELNFLANPQEKLDIPIPVFNAFLTVVRFVWALVSDDAYSPFALQALVSNTITGIIVGIAVFLLTRSLAATLVSTLLFFSSPWAGKYLLMVSYTSFATALFMASFLCFVAAYIKILNGRQGQELLQEHSVNCTVSSAVRVDLNVGMLLALSGALEGLYFLSSSSAIPLVLLQLVALGTVIWRARRKDAFFLFFSFVLSMAYMGWPGSMGHLLEIMGHWAANAWPYSYEYFFIIFGHGYETLKYSLPRLSLLYDPLVLISFVLSAPPVFYLYIKKKSPRDDLLEVLFLVGAVIVVFGLLMENGIFTKLARTLFPVYPLMILFVTLAGFYLFKRFCSSWGVKKQRALAACIFAVVAVWVYGNVLKDVRLAEAKQSVGDFVGSMASRVRFYLLAQDPHMPHLEKYLVHGVSVVNDLKSIKAAPDETVGLILGPRGPHSGFSDIWVGFFDFYPERFGITKPPGATEKILKYYAFEPFFAMEVEATQYLYFSGRFPSSRNNDKQVLVWLWKPGGV